jgi:hypothetical protein
MVCIHQPGLLEGVQSNGKYDGKPLFDDYTILPGTVLYACCCVLLVAAMLLLLQCKGVVAGGIIVGITGVATFTP